MYLLEPSLSGVGVCTGASITSQHRLKMDIHSFEPSNSIYTQEKDSYVS